MIRWGRQEDGNWLGLSGELLVATVAKDASEKEQWLWTITALKRPKGWRKGAGHRSSWIDARRAAEEYWERWLQEAALRPDVMRLASRSVVKERERKSRAERAGEKSLVSSGAPEGCGGSLGGKHPFRPSYLPIAGKLVIISLRCLFAGGRGKLHRRLDLFRQRQGE